jgi:7-keto-8-aminopelargonate synthetase-like enzyme
VSTGGRSFIFFGGCDYFRLSSHPKVLRAAERASRRAPLGVSASRCTTGNHAALEQLEQKLAKFFQAPHALVVANGYATNLIVAQALAGRFQHVLLDERAHGSLADAAMFLGGSLHRFPHRDVSAVRKLAGKLTGSGPAILLTDGLCAHDGHVAPLREYRAILPKGSWMLMDDAHGGGVIGRNGRGGIEHADISRARIIQTTTLSKAFGCHGGVILCDAPIRRQIITRSRMFIGSTPPALPLVAAALTAVEVLRRNPDWRRRATDHAERVREVLREHGRTIESAPAPIVPMIAGNPREADRLSEILRAHGILPPRLKYPGSPAGGYFRFVISSEHSDRQIEILSLALHEWLAGKNPGNPLEPLGSNGTFLASAIA